MGDTRENYLKLGEEDWDLRSLFQRFENWLREVDGTLPEATLWIADIGFMPREAASGGGPIISRRLLSLCLRNNVEIYLSEYSG